MVYAYIIIVLVKYRPAVCICNICGQWPLLCAPLSLYFRHLSVGRVGPSAAVALQQCTTLAMLHVLFLGALIFFELFGSHLPT